MTHTPDQNHDLRDAILRAIALAGGERPSSESWTLGLATMRWRAREGRPGMVIRIASTDGALAPVVTIGSGEDDGVEIVAGTIADAPEIAELAARFPSVLGRILWKEEKDRWDNDVSIALLPGGRRMRIVHHAPKKPWHRTVRSTVYRGRDDFVRITSTRGRNDCCYDELDVAGYGMCWGDGEIGPIENNPDGPDLSETIRRHASHQDEETAILTVLGAIADVDVLWHSKISEPARIAA